MEILSNPLNKPFKLDSDLILKSIFFDSKYSTKTFRSINNQLYGSKALSQFIKKLPQIHQLKIWELIFSQFLQSKSGTKMIISSWILTEYLNNYNDSQVKMLSIFLDLTLLIYRN